MSPWATRALLLVTTLLVSLTYSQVLTPSQITISHRKPITATSTCGEIKGSPIKEVYCSLTGSSQYTPLSSYSYQENEQRREWAHGTEVRGGHGCAYCNAGDENAHPASNMVDGNNSWWMSPPLSRGLQHNEVNITIDLEQEFHVAYVWIQMANSPRPGSWVLERSTDHGKTYQPWINFAENAAECMRRFGEESLSPISEDDSVTCRTDMASLTPLENAEMVIRILENRPSSKQFATSEALQNFTRATNVRLRLLGTRTLQGHLMDMNEWRDATVTRRYFYAIKEIMIGGRCVCNGHAVTCDILEPQRPKSLLCRCEHNTCGDMCERCCPGFVQKQWQPATAHNNFTCEACNCFGRSNECYYDEKVDLEKLSVDSNGKYEGGGVCVNCRDNTEGINCNKCSYGYFRPAGVNWDEPQPCKACDCDPDKHTGSCAEETGKCECQARFVGENCDQCAPGYYDPPECKPCECHVNGTVGDVCLPEGGQCPCKPGFGGTFCETCAAGFTNVTAGCQNCVCDPTGSEHSNCSAATGQCECKPAYAGLSCDKCQVGYFGESCTFCNCDPMGTEGGVCDQTTGQCLCKEGFAGDKCDRCDIAFYGYPNCKACACDGAGTSSPECDTTSGQCPCNGNFTGRTCDKCAAGFYNYPDCRGCECLIAGAKGQTCDNNGQCYCKDSFEGERCERCKPNFYNFPVCEECNCNPSGVTRDFQGCDKVSPGELCSCKKHVTGRICNLCKPTFWDLQYHHEDGCKSCDCNTNGTISSLNTCDLKTGQCMCKKNADGRRCDQCADGFYRLNSYNQLGCEPCHCDIGGALRAECDIQSGQCKCRPRVTGLRCDRPIENHYFPTLWHNQYEAEDAHTEDQRPVRFAVDPEQFANYSWRGYAVFSPIQEKILIDVDISKASVYRFLFRYRNPTSVPITATVSVSPRFTHTHDVEQSAKITFPVGDDPAMKEITVDGKPFVLNPGKWVLAIATKQRLFLDYVVVIPSEYYEGQALRQRPPTPCLSHSTKNTTCVDLIYPPIPSSSARVFVDMENVPFNYIAEDGSITPLEHVPVEILPSEITGPAAFVRADENSRVVEAKIDVPESGEYVVVIEYHNREETDGNVGVGVNQNDKEILNGNVVIHHCPYATFCRELVSSAGTIPYIPLEKGEATVRLNIKPNHEFGLAAIHLIKKNEFSSEYLQQVPVCIRKEGRCVPQSYPPAADSVVTEAEAGANMDKSILGDKLPFPVSNSREMRVLPLDDAQATIEISGVVPTRGHYMFIVHYFNPDNTPLDIDVLLQNEHYFQGDSCNSYACYSKYSPRFFFNATAPLAFCPSISGCRALIRDKERPEVIQFFMDDKYTATFYHNATQKGPIYIDSITAVPYNSYNAKLMKPLALDLSNEFLKECSGDNLRNHPETVSDFCKQKIFSLTTDFNAAALSCDCVAQGSESFQCEEYGGQCKCKPNVIGRRCERCAPGYYNFPECIKCQCNNGQQCDERTGQCFCPPHVEGQTCDKCVSNAFGYDPLIGCQKCGCHPQGSEGGNLVCDPESGQCLCRESMGGRQCDRCLAGFYGFPHCYGCSCNRAGTTDEICDATNAQCKCKENVYGARCEACKAGTFDLSAENPLGCVNCYCFGVTDSCRSSMYPVSTMSVDMGAFITNDENGTIENKDDTVIYTASEKAPNSVYFVVPIAANQDYTTSYGLKLTFKLSVLPRDGKKSMNADADVRLTGANMTVEFWAPEQPANPEEQFTVKVKLVPENFVTVEGKSVTREDLMKVLHSLQKVTLKASYFDSPQSSTLNEFGLEISEPNGFDSVLKASSVEQCQCPAPYTGPSCQLCASGYHRVQSGSFLGACVPCECNGHSATCDPDTGICTDCEHNTHGDHCEFCDEGHYGNATNGSPYDCMACACPFAPSNNFAKSCDVSEEGQLLQCNCKPGYTGDRCDKCAAGFFGQPQQQGGSCEPCQCNNNNNLTDSRACHPVSGDCYLCEQHTDGRHCEWCAQWFYGDAVTAKNCSSCECDQCGSSYCDNKSGGCECKTNVEGDSCDRCKPDHWGFSKCQGCQACHCGTAAFNTQCNVENGQCTCRPGATGMRCEHCEHGYWNYGEHGCDKCDCEADLSMGTVCDVRTGQCHCQEGATGSRCDQCLPSYLRIPTYGCRRCDECVHHLIGDVDNLELEIDVLGTAIGNISSATIVGARLARNKKEFSDISEITKMLNDEENSFGNVFGDASDILTNATQILQKLNRTKNHSINSSAIAKNLTVNGTEFLQDVMKKAHRARMSVRSLADIALAIGSSSKAVNVDPRLLKEAEDTLMTLEATSADPYPEKANIVPGKLEEIQKKIKEEGEKLDKQKEKLEAEKKKAEELATYLNSAQQLLKESKSKSDKANNLAKMLQLTKVQNLVAAINDDLERADTIKGEFQKVNVAIGNLTENLKDRREDLAHTLTSLNETRNDVAEALEAAKKRVRRDEKPVDLQLVNAKVNELHLQATTLRQTFDNSKDNTDQAVEAANAYSNLTDTLKKAKENIDNAFALIEEESKYVEEIQSAKNNLKTDSKDKIDEIEKSVREDIREVEKMKIQLDQLTEFADKLRKRRDSVKAGIPQYNKDVLDQVDEKIKQVESLKAEIDGVVEETRKKINDISGKAEEITEKANSAMEGIRLARRNSVQLNKLAPIVASKFEELKKLTAARTGKVDSISDKVSQIKEMIAVARDAANRIKLGAHFEKGSSLDLNIPQRVSRSAAHADISFYFRTEQEHGIPLFFGNEESAVGSRAVPTADFVAAEIEYSRPKITVNLGDAPVVVKLETPVNDGQWRRLTIERIGKTVNVTITKPNSVETAETKSGVADGNKSVLNLNQQISKLYVGGIPRSAAISKDLYNREFIGDVEQLKLHGEPIGLWNSRKNGSSNVTGSPKKPKITDNAEELSISLDGEGYTSYKPSHWNPRKATKISLSFLTFSPHGLLFFVGKDRDFMSLELSDGGVKLSVDLGSGVGQWTTESSNYNDGKWHTVSIVREEKHVKIMIDGKDEVLEGDVPGKESEMSVTEFLYIGGIPSGLNVRTTIVPLRGCIKSVKLGSDDVDLESSQASKGVRSGCPINTVRTVSFLSDRTTASFTNVTNLSEDVSVTFKFKTKVIRQSSSLFTVNDDEDSVLSLTINEDGILTATSGEDTATLELAASPDEKWHYVSIRKTRHVIRIDADDSFSNEVARKNGDDSNPDASHLSAFFGKVGEKSSFVGCIGDVTLNGKLLDFAKADIKEISLSGCSLTDDENVLTTTAVPKTTPVPATVTPVDDTGVAVLPLDEEDATTTTSTTEEPTEPPAEMKDVYSPTTKRESPEQSENVDHFESIQVSTVRPDGHCALPEDPLVQFDGAEGFNFGTQPHSRIEYDVLPEAIDKSGEFSFKIRPTAVSGIVFIATNKRTDHIAVMLENGRVVFTYDTGSGQVVIKSDKSIIDGRWHSIKVSRRGKSAHLIVDDDSYESEGAANQNEDLIETSPPFFVGGVPSDMAGFARTLLPGVRSQFSGCIKDLRLNGKSLENGKEFGTEQCSQFTEEGMYFGKDGGYAIVQKEYEVGQSFGVELEMRPRMKDGILFSVGVLEYITVEYVNGSIKTTVDSGSGGEDLFHHPATENEFCDGHWQSLKISKKKNLLTVTVNGKAHIKILKKAKADILTKDPLYFGGVPDGVSNKGLTTRKSFVGCVRFVSFGLKKDKKMLRRKKAVDTERFDVFGDVHRNGCPAI
uniref:Laminin-like protein epi-1 n=2 Tax=Caenorhabditis japonica TaxID=281687 RepID=A0A8R1I6V3_CAEJA